MSNERVYSVSQITSDVRFTLEEQFPLVWVEGEISNFRRPRSGHWYFSLKDERAQLRCAMFVNRNRFVRNPVDDGAHVVIRGRLTLYEGRGDFQAVVDHIEPAGEGALRAAFDQLKVKLAAEGLFAPEHKRPVPEFPRHIAIISSESGAALHDVISVLERRYPAVAVSLLPVLVQGVDAERDLLRAFARIDWLVQQAERAPDVVIVTRGGGSLEDLMAFNLESVARRIAACPVPVVSAIGHETDVTIADFVADARAPTPSVAAELVTPDQREIRLRLSRAANTLANRMTETLSAEQRILGLLERRLIHPGRQLEQQIQRVDELAERLARAGLKGIEALTLRCGQAARAVARHDPRLQIATSRQQLDVLGSRLTRALDNRQRQSNERVAAIGRALHAVSPLATLDRGYAIVARPDGSRWGIPIKEAAGLEPGSAVQLHFHDASVAAEVRAPNKTRGEDDA